MSKNFSKIKSYYDTRLWNKNMVYNTVGVSTGITEEEYFLITGTPYDEETFPEEISGHVYLYDFSRTVSGTLYPVTSDVEISNLSTGRFDLSAGDMTEGWAIGGLPKYEIFNGNTRIDAIPCFMFSLNGQKVLRCGFRTSGTEERPFTKIKGTLLLKRR